MTDVVMLQADESKELTPEAIQAKLNSTKQNNLAQIRVLKKFRKINKYMLGGRDYVDNAEVIIVDEDADSEEEDDKPTSDNKWPLLELVANVTGELERMLVVACMEELIKGNPTWVYLKNEPRNILKRIKDWMILNNKYVLQTYEIGNLPYVIEFCKTQDEKWGRWTIFEESQSSLPEYLLAHA